MASVSPVFNFGGLILHGMSGSRLHNLGCIPQAGGVGMGTSEDRRQLERQVQTCHE